MPSKKANVKNEKQYEALKDKGMSKQRAAKIANSPGASSRGGKKSGSGGNSSQGGTTAQKNPASESPPSSSAAVRASWSGAEKRLVPRPLQVKSSAPAARSPSSAAARFSRRSASAEASSRTWKRSVWPIRTASPTASAPDSSSTPVRLRIR